MRLFVFLLLALLPLAMSAGHEDHHGHEGHSSEDCDRDHQEEQEMRKMMQELGMEIGEWREEMKEWLERPSDWRADGHDDSHEKRDDHHDDSHERRDDHHDDSHDEREKSRQLYQQFQEFLSHRAKEREAQQERAEEFRNQVHQFQDYLKLKKMQEYERQRSVMEEQRQREFEENTHMLRERYRNASHEYTRARFNFTFSIANQVLDICQCDDRKSMMMRLRNGHFGQGDMGGHGGNHTGGTTFHPTHSPSTTFPNSSFPSHSPSNSTRPPQPPPPEPSQNSSSSNGNNGNLSSRGPPGNNSFPTDAPPHGNSSHPGNHSGVTPTWSPPTTDSGHHDDDHDDGLSRDEIMEILTRLSGMRPEEQLQYVIHRLTRHMCEFAGVYMEHLADLEEGIHDYIMMHGGSHHY